MLVRFSIYAIMFCDVPSLIYPNHMYKAVTCDSMIVSLQLAVQTSNVLIEIVLASSLREAIAVVNR